MWPFTSRRRARALAVAASSATAIALLIPLLLLLGATQAVAASSSLVVTTTSLPAVEAGEPLSIQLAAAGGATPYQWVPDSLPSGVTITSGGLLGGAATSTGGQNVVISVVDADNQRTTVTLDLVVNSAPSITTTSLPDAQLGAAYGIQLGEANGTAPFTWSVPKGGLPGGFLLSSSGLLSGRPGTSGTDTIELQITDALGASSQASVSVDVLSAPLPSEGYATVDAAGRTASVGLVAPSSVARVPGKTVGLAAEVSGAGYWTVTSVGQVHASGAARFFGSIARRYLEGDAVGIAAPLGGTGYWVVSSTGHVYGFGAARSLGSVSKRALRSRIVAIAATPEGRGYWLVTSTGRVYAFGSARSYGSVPSRALRGKIVAIAPATATVGYFVTSSTGRVYGFGGARPLPPTSGPATGAIVGIAVAPAQAGAGYWLLTRSGAIYGYGAARELATIPPQPVTRTTTLVPAVAIAGAR